MKVKLIPDGGEIKVGDFIRVETFLGKKWFKVVRETPKRVYIRWNEKCEGAFPKIVPTYRLRPMGDNDPWTTTKYSAWRPVEEPVQTEPPK